MKLFNGRLEKTRKRLSRTDNLTESQFGVQDSLETRDVRNKSYSHLIELHHRRVKVTPVILFDVLFAKSFGFYVIEATNTGCSLL